jgi:hypothetical protein
MAHDLRRHARAIARSMQQDAVTGEVVTALEAHDVDALLLKGPSVARWLYPEGGRSYVDTDLLIAPAAWPIAERVLASLDFHRSGFYRIADDRPHYAIVFRRLDGASLDLHRTLIGVGVSPEVLWTELWSRVEPMRVGGREIQVLQPPARALVIALHAAKDGGRVAKADEDLRRAVATLDIGTWKQAVEVARRLEAEVAFAGGLRRTAGGAILATVLGLTDEVSVDVALRRDGPAPPLAVGLAWLISTPGVRGKGRVLLAKAFPPAAFMREWLPIARRGRLGLFAAYLWRPFWLMTRSVPAMKSVLAARRTAKGVPSGHERTK